MKRFNFEWFGIKYHLMNSYDKIVFNYLMGQLCMETTDFVPEDCLITIERSHSEINSIYVRCYGVNEELIKGYFKDFPLMTDTNFIGKGMGYGGIMIRSKTLKIKPVTVQELSYSMS